MHWSSILVVASPLTSGNNIKFNCLEKLGLFNIIINFINKKKKTFI